MFRPVMTAQEVVAFLDSEFPQIRTGQSPIEVDAVGPGTVHLRLAAEESHLRPGGTVSGPSLFALADVGAYLAVVAHLGPQAKDVVTTNMSINFLKRPRPGLIRAEARLLKLGRRLAVAEVAVFAAADDEPCAHAVGTYAIPTLTT
ncbi:PaaI family thioesterase [Aureimonas populi]|uniref:PaaI family thioesterase n=1 Tax=Aureimonas populi TaxID=1701758 RepID=A0ABW5CGD4_9HYPH|nr:PaaI family thioesterase [Aureimonas populi]